MPYPPFRKTCFAYMKLSPKPVFTLLKRFNQKGCEVSHSFA